MPAQVKIDGSGLFKVDLIDPWLMKIYPLGYTRGGSQAFVQPITPALLRFSKTGTLKVNMTTGSLTELLAKFAGDTTHARPPELRPFKVETEYFSAEYKLGELLDDPRATSILEKYVPSLVKLATEMPISRGVALKDCIYLEEESRQGVDAAQLSAASAELGKISAK